ncbi:MAG: hypothetical protein HY329_19610 [Chloroflexi bacterium]|nr:hypothetical protein [Chloroflexota bacterium]
MDVTPSGCGGFFGVPLLVVGLVWAGPNYWLAQVEWLVDQRWPELKQAG